MPSLYEGFVMYLQALYNADVGPLRSRWPNVKVGRPQPYGPGEVRI